MKKTVTLLVTGLLIILTAACGNKDTITQDHLDQDKITVYTTVYPLTYFTQRIAGDLVQVKSIYPAGSNEHTFDPTQQDMMALADADLFFYIGLGLEGFVDNAKKTLAHEQVKMIATSTSVAEEELLQEVSNGQESSDEDAHHHDAIDPHLWISPTISIKLAKSIKESLIERDPSNEATYTKNFESLQADLEELDAKFQEMANGSTNKTFFVSHAAFGYLAGAYGLHQVAIAGLNSQDEPSQKELTKIVEQAKAKQINTILFEQNVSSNLAKVIQAEVGAKAGILHNLSVLTEEDVKNEETYFTLMEKNIITLKKALK